MRPSWRLLAAAGAASSLLLLALACLAPAASAEDSPSELGYFTVSQLEVLPGDNITFTINFDNSTVDAWVWVFDDGTYNTSESVNKSWASLGKRRVHLLIVDDGAIIDDAATVEVGIKTFDWVFNVCCYGCVVPSLFLPFAAIGLLFEFWGRKRDPGREHYHLGLKAWLLAPIFFASLLLPVVFTIFFYFPAAGCVSGFMMAAVGLASIGVLASVIWLVRLTKFGRRAISSICIIPKGRRRLRRFRDAFFGAFKDRLAFAFHISPMPLALIFFLAALASRNVESIDEIFSSWNLFYILMAAPFVSIVLVPIQLMGDSSLVALKAKDVTKAIQIQYLGSLLRRWAQSITGFGAITAFVSVVVGFYIENFHVSTDLSLMWDTMGVTLYALGEALGVILLISAVTYAGLWTALFVYSFFHEGLVNLLDRWIMSLHLPTYRIFADESGDEIRLVRDKPSVGVAAEPEGGAASPSVEPAVEGKSP